MALKRPGTASRFTFLTTMFWAGVMITVLVAGHLTLAFLFYAKFTGSSGMDEVIKFTGQPAWLLWLSIIAAIALDIWIYYHHRKDRMEALRR